MEAVKPAAREVWWNAGAPPLLAAAGDPEAAPGLVRIKESVVRSVYRASGSLCLKAYRAVTLFDRIASLWRRSKSRREFRCLEEAARRGIPVAPALCFGVERGLLPRRGFLVTPWIEG